MCDKVKNPCKICLNPVTQKNGLQCSGACESWVHYECLNYTKGRIQDIKEGIIKVTCPCPDCKTSMPKEFRTDQPFSCTNMECPANRPIKCENSGCPSSKGAEKMNQTSGFKVPQPEPCALNKCGVNDCKTHSYPSGKLTNPCQPVSGKQGGQGGQGGQGSQGGQGGQGGQGYQGNQFQPMMPYNQMHGMTSSSDACLDFNRCPSGCSSANVSEMQQSNPAMEGQMPSMFTMEQMCNTVGLLSKQINELMNKMQNNNKSGKCCIIPSTTTTANYSPGNGQTPCMQKGPKAMCPKPCFCPDNPGYRK